MEEDGEEEGEEGEEEELKAEKPEPVFLKKSAPQEAGPSKAVQQPVVTKQAEVRMESEPIKQSSGVEKSMAKAETVVHQPMPSLSKKYELDSEDDLPMINDDEPDSD